MEVQRAGQVKVPLKELNRERLVVMRAPQQIPRHYKAKANKTRELLTQEQINSDRNQNESPEDYNHRQTI